MVVGRAGQIHHVTFLSFPSGSADTNRQIVLKCYNKILGSAFLHPLKCPSLPVESIQGSQLRNQGFSTVLLGHGVVYSRGGKSTWVLRSIPKSSCHRHPCVLFSHPKSCLAEKIPNKNSAHPRPSRSGASGRNNGLSFPSKMYIFLLTKLEACSCPCLEFAL